MKFSVLSFALLAGGLVGCEKGQLPVGQDQVEEVTQVEESSAVVASWQFGQKTSPVRGTIHMANLTEDDSETPFRKQVQMECLPQSHRVRMEFAIFGNDGGTAQFITRGNSVITALYKSRSIQTPKEDSSLCRGDMRNTVLNLRENPVDWLQDLPVAFELETNNGMVAFEIPQTDEMVQFLNVCVHPTAEAEAKEAKELAEAKQLKSDKWQAVDFARAYGSTHYIDYLLTQGRITDMERQQLIAEAEAAKEADRVARGARAHNMGDADDATDAAEDAANAAKQAQDAAEEAAASADGKTSGAKAIGNAAKGVASEMAQEAADAAERAQDAAEEAAASADAEINNDGN